MFSLFKRRGKRFSVDQIKAKEQERRDTLITERKKTDAVRKRVEEAVHALLMKEVAPDAKLE